MTVLRESPWYQEIEQRGEQRGRLQESQSLILHLLTRRFGELSPAVRSQIEALTLERTKALGEMLLDFTEHSDLEKWLATSTELLPSPKQHFF